MFKEKLLEVRGSLTQLFELALADENYLKRIFQEPAVRVSPIPLPKSIQVWEATDYNYLKNSKLNLIGSQEISTHSSFHTLAACNVEDRFYMTGHSDSTFRIWGFNHDYFMTPFNRKSDTKLARTDDFLNSVKTSKPFSLLYTSPCADFHSHFVTAITGYERAKDLKMIIGTGDGKGH
jgi:hypothetical protein